MADLSTSLQSLSREGFTPPFIPPRGPGSAPPRVGGWPFFVFQPIFSLLFLPSFFGCFLGSIFGRFSAPTWHQKSIKIDQKSMPRCLPSWALFFDRFLVDCGANFDPRNLKHRAPAATTARWLKDRLSKVTSRFASISGANLAAVILP